MVATLMYINRTRARGYLCFFYFNILNMGANNSNIKSRQNYYDTPPKTNNRLLFDPRSPSGKRLDKII